MIEFLIVDVKFFRKSMIEVRYRGFFSFFTDFFGGLFFGFILLFGRVRGMGNFIEWLMFIFFVVIGGGRCDLNIG